MIQGIDLVAAEKAGSVALPEPIRREPPMEPGPKENHGDPGRDMFANPPKVLDPLSGEEPRPVGGEVEMLFPAMTNGMFKVMFGGLPPK